MTALPSTTLVNIPDQSDLAPIALFVFNRPDHTQKTLDALQRNDLASRSDLFVFSDGARNESDIASVRAVNRCVRAIRGFRSVTVIESDRNFGLANSVLAGVTQLCDEFGRLIVLEDDILTTPDFLTFMNRALEHYRCEPRVFSVSAFNFALPVPDSCKFPYDAFCFYRSSSWGWGTWNDRWQRVDWEVSDYQDLRADKRQQKKFQRAGEDLLWMLNMQMAGKIDSWAIRWAYAHCKHDALAVLSVLPRAFNIGDDGSGIHTRRGGVRQLPLASESKVEFRFPDVIEPEASFTVALQRSLRPSLLRKVVRSLRLNTRLSFKWKAARRVN
jgi:hypothetical protein